jgi:hypothetical protein
MGSIYVKDSFLKHILQGSAIHAAKSTDPE